MSRLTFARIEEARQTLGRTVLLFITDRCPVGCGHCSVDSRPDSPRITDFVLFEDIVDALCAGDFTLIGISGGEPFVERRGLDLATERIVAAGKDVVVVTSGVWAAGDTAPAWVRRVLGRCATVILSTDSFHEAAVADRRFVRAATAIASAGTWIVVQVLDLDDMVERATHLLVRAFGPAWRDHAELHRIPPLPYGRAASLFRRVHRRPGAQFTQRCRVLDAPVVRYDGVVSACCNEAVLMGAGPAALRRRCASGAEASAAMARFRTLPLLRAIATTGPGPLTAHPRLADLADEQFTDICQVCWPAIDRLADDPTADAVMSAVVAIGRRG